MSALDCVAYMNINGSRMFSSSRTNEGRYLDFEFFMSERRTLEVIHRTPPSIALDPFYIQLVYENRDITKINKEAEYLCW